MVADKFERCYKIADIFIKVFGIISIFLTLHVIDIHKQKLHDDNERARREFSFNLVLNAQDKIGRGLFCANFLIDISSDKLSKVISFNELSIDKSNISKLNGCLAGQNADDLLKLSHDNIILAKAGSYYVLNQTVHDLNLLETLMSAYYSGIVDKDIMRDLLDATFVAKPIELFINKLNSKTGQKSFMNLLKYISESRKNKFTIEKLPLGELK